jgi:nucleotide-binding universal stress UspA family protein
VFRHLLVPIDLSDGNGRVLRTAFDLAAATDARVTVLHVVTQVRGIPAAELRSFYDQLEARAKARLGAVMRKYAQPGMDVRPVTILGDPARDLVRWAEQERADLIVIGSHSVEPRRGQRVGWGSISYKIALLCRCPVLLVKAAPARPVRRRRTPSA